MSHCLRYQKAAVCEHLASQYVAGVMTSRVRARMEKLIRMTPELERSVARWADDFSELHDRFPEAPEAFRSKQEVWEKIEAQLPKNNTSVASTLWNSLFAWRILGGVSSLASLVFVTIVWLAAAPTPAPGPTPDYIASMSAHNDAAKTVKFVVTAYERHTNVHLDPHLHLRWPRAHVESSKKRKPLHIWAESNDSQLTYLGIYPVNASRLDLGEVGWQAIVNSKRLLITENDQKPVGNNIVFSGLCLHLSSWKS